MAAKVESQMMRGGPAGATRIPVAVPRTIPPHVPDNAANSDISGKTNIGTTNGANNTGGMRTNRSNTNHSNNSKNGQTAAATSGSNNNQNSNHRTGPLVPKDSGSFTSSTNGSNKTGHTNTSNTGQANSNSRPSGSPNINTTNSSRSHNNNTSISRSPNNNSNSGTVAISNGSNNNSNPNTSRRAKLRRLNLAAASAPEHPLYPNGPPPEDGLAGANTARTTSLASHRTTTQDGGKNTMMSVQVRAGLQRVYVEGMEYMKARISDVREELARIQCDYHQTQVPDDEQFVSYLKTCDKHFLRANTELRKRSVKLEVIDSETRLVALLNQVREDDSFDQKSVAYLTEYWENVKSTVESLKAVVSKFQTTVLNRLKLNYISYNSTDTHLEVCAEYTEDISNHMTDMERLLSNVQILLKSFHSGIHQDLYDSSRFVELVMVSCDLKAFPVLRLVADVYLKVNNMCDIAVEWLARDQRFMTEIHDYIREARHAARRREEDLRSQKEKQKKYEKSMKAANILLKNNRDKLHKIETELHVLEEQLTVNESEKKCRYDELHQKESMVDFLKLTLSQTKRNYNLQSKRSKLLRQVDDLKELLTSMERELEAIQSEIQVKAEEKVRLSEKVENSERSYETLRTDMDRFSNSLEHLETEVTALSGQLLQLEIIHNLKTSPEKVDEIYDRPSTVKLAPSLKEKIKARKRKALKAN